MPQIKSILCPIDFSGFSVSAYEYAQSLAGHYKAKLLLQHVLYSMKPFAFWNVSSESYEEVCRKRLAEVERQLQDFAKWHKHTEIEPQCFAQDGSVIDLILSLAEAQAVDLIVMGTHGSRGIDRLLLGSVTEKVLRHAQRPVLAVRKPPHHGPSSAHDQKPVDLKKMLLCTDFSEHADRASTYALSMAKEYGAELTLLHVLEDIPISTDLRGATEQVLEHLNQFVPMQECRGCSVRSVVRVGKPYQQIIQLALEAQIDVIFMGARGRGALDAALFGSTTYRVLQLGSCPVLTVHM